MNLDETKEEIIEKKRMDISVLEGEIAAVEDAIELELEFAEFDEDEMWMPEIGECIKKLEELKKELMEKLRAVKAKKPTMEQESSKEVVRKVAEKIKELRKLMQKLNERDAKKGEDDEKVGAICSAAGANEKDAKKGEDDEKVGAICSATGANEKDAKKGKDDEEKIEEVNVESDYDDDEIEEVKKVEKKTATEENSDESKTVTGENNATKTDGGDIEEIRSDNEDETRLSNLVENNEDVSDSDQIESDSQENVKVNSEEDIEKHQIEASVNETKEDEGNIVKERENEANESENDDEDDEIEKVEKKTAIKCKGELEKKESPEKKKVSESENDEDESETEKEENGEASKDIVKEDVLEHDIKLLPNHDQLVDEVMIEVAAAFPLLQAQRGEPVAPSLNLPQTHLKVMNEDESSEDDDTLGPQLDKAKKEIMKLETSTQDVLHERDNLKLAKIDASRRVKEVEENTIETYEATLLPKDVHIIREKFEEHIIEKEVTLKRSRKVSQKYVSKDTAIKFHEKAVPLVKWLKEAEKKDIMIVKFGNYSMVSRNEDEFGDKIMQLRGKFKSRTGVAYDINNQYRQIGMGNEEYGEFVMDLRLVVPAVSVKPREGIGVYEDSTITDTPSKFFINGDKFFKGAMLDAKNEESPNFNKLLEHLTRIMCNQGTLPNNESYVYSSYSTFKKLTSLVMRRDIGKKCMEHIKDIGVYKDKLTNCYCQFDPGITCNQQGGLELLGTDPQFSGELRRASVQLSGGSERGVHGRGVQVERFETVPQFSGE